VDDDEALRPRGGRGQAQQARDDDRGNDAH
jgi:hypothetical protein